MSWSISSFIYCWAVLSHNTIKHVLVFTFLLSFFRKINTDKRTCCYVAISRWNMHVIFSFLNEIWNKRYCSVCHYNYCLLCQLKVKAEWYSLTWRPIEKEIASSSVVDKETAIWWQKGQFARIELRSQWHLYYAFIYLYMHLFKNAYF